MAGFMDFLRNNNGALLQTGLGLLSGQTGTQQAALGAQGLANALNENKTFKYLDRVNPTLAAEVRAGKPIAQAWEELSQQRLSAQRPRNNFMSAGGSIFNTETGEWLTPPQGTGSDAEFGLNPQYGVDANGNPVILQISKSGTSKQTPLPDGISLSKEPIKLDAGTHFVLLDPITRQPVGQIPKNLEEAERQKAAGSAVGEAAGAATAALPGARDMAGAVSQQVESLKNDPYLPNMLGPVDSRTPDITVDAARVRSKMDQLQGGAFLQARQMLKGGGAITDFESQRAEQAFARLNRAQSDADYIAALDEFNHWVQLGIAKLERQAAMGQGVPPAAAPQGGGSGGTTGSGVKWRVK